MTDLLHLLGDPFHRDQGRPSSRRCLFGLAVVVVLATLLALGTLVVADRSGRSWVRIGQHVDGACPEVLRPACPFDCRETARVCYPLFH